MGKRLFFILMIQTGISFLIATLFVILFFRIYPDKMLTLFPLSFVLGMILGIISYLPVKSLLEKK